MLKWKSFWNLFPREMFDGMKRQQVFSTGSFIVVLILVITIMIWLGHFPGSIRNPLVGLAKFNAFLAISTLSLNFILATRSKILENLFNGLDRMYRVHKVVGRSSLFFMLGHPFFLGLSKIPDWEMMVKFLIPIGPLGISAGIISLYIFVILVILTVSVSLPYHFWHNSHKFLGVVLLLALFHAVAVGSDIRNYPVLAFWIILLASGGIVSWLYMLIFYKQLGPKYKVKVLSVKHLTDITEIHVEKPEGFAYHPGQYIFIRFPRFEGIRELFPFSISNDPSQSTIRLTIRRGGDFTSNKVPLIKKGEDTILMGPYGKFGERYLKHDKDMVWIAGGIGITPFLSLAKHETINPTGRRIHLIWVMKGLKDAFHDSELFVEAKKNRNFDYVHWFSSEKGRIEADDILMIVGGKEEMKKRITFMCGPPPMMYSLSHALQDKGIPYRNIIYEDFNMLD